MRINKSALNFIIIFAVFYFTVGNTAFAQNENSNSYEKFIIMPSIWDTYLKEEIPKQIPKFGQILCINNKSLNSRVINGNINFKEVGYILENKNGLQSNIIGCEYNEKPFFFITNKPKKLLSVGKVNTVFLIRNESKKANINNLNFKYSGKEYKFIQDKKQCNAKDRCKLKVILNANNKKQIIIAKNIYDRMNNCGHPTVIWAGDADNDRILDFIITYSDDSYLTYEFFLSSQAEKGKLVKSIKKLTYWLE